MSRGKRDPHRPAASAPHLDVALRDRRLTSDFDHRTIVRHTKYALKRGAVPGTAGPDAHGCAWDVDPGRRPAIACEQHPLAPASDGARGLAARGRPIDP
jgi:hypothetical protein